MGIKPDETGNKPQSGRQPLARSSQLVHAYQLGRTTWAGKEIHVARQRRGGTKKVRKVMREFKTGTLKSSSGAKVRKRKQAIAIALSEARQAGAKIPKKKAAAKKKKTAAKR